MAWHWCIGSTSTRERSPTAADSCAATPTSATRKRTGLWFRSLEQWPRPIPARTSSHASFHAFRLSVSVSSSSFNIMKAGVAFYCVFLLQWKEHESISPGVFSYVYISMRAEVNLAWHCASRAKELSFCFGGSFIGAVFDKERFFISLWNRSHRQCQRELCQVQGRLLCQHGDQLHETNWPPEFGDQREGKRLD